MPIAPASIFDSFTRAVTSGFGTSDSGYLWQGTTSDYMVSSSGYGRISVPAGRGTSIAWIDYPVNQGTQEILVKVKWNTDNLTDHGPVLRRAGSNSYYYLRIQDYYHEAAIAVNANGSIYELNRASTIALNRDQWYWVRFRADATGLHARIWSDGSAEPSTWTVESGYFDGSNPPGSGDFGYYTRGASASYSVYLDTLYWYTLEDTEPAPPVNDTFSRNVDKGWGWSTSGHLWEGNLADDPTYYALQGQGTVNSAGYAELVTANSGTSRNGIIGPAIANSEAVVLASVDSITANPEVLIGVRGAASDSNGNYQFRGYYARLIWGSTSFTLRKVSTIGGASTQIGTTFTLAAAPAANERWFVKIRADGTTISAKAWKDGTTEPDWQITVTDADLSSGRAFIRLIGASTATHTFRVYSFQHNAVTTANALTTGTLSFSSVTDTSFAVTATYTNDTNSNSSCTIQYRLAGTEAWTSASVTTDRTNRRFNGTITGLSQGTTYEVQVTYADPDGVVGTNPLFGSVTTALNGVTSGSLSLVATATTIDVTLTYTNDANNNSSASVQIRTLPNGTFGASQPMSVNRANKTFSYQFTGLANDTSYEIRATYSDPDGVFGPNPLVGSIVTLGKSVQPQSIIVTPSATAATVTVTYQYDNNANSTLGLQYRSIHHAIWTTVNSSSLTVNRGSKRFTATLTQLRPNTTYEVEATFSDPDGVAPGSSATLRAVFSTPGPETTALTDGKRYVYKVYSIDGTFLGTWADAPVPEFQYHLNGGATDMTVTLPRKVADLNNDPTLALGNRVDVWAIDSQGLGMGPNLLRDWDMDLGSWNLNPDGGTTVWSIDPTGGPDGGNALRFSSTNATARYALSETITLNAKVPVVLRCIARALGGKLRVDLVAFDATNAIIAVSETAAETIGTRWQTLTLTWTPPQNTAYLRIRAQNDGSGTMWLDKVTLLTQEMLIYRGRIESYEVHVRQDGESVDVELLGPVSVLSDDYIRFLQYVTVQPTRDINAKRPKKNPTDPAQMMREIIDIARQQNPRCDLYYTADSIKSTNTTVEYTFRDQQLFAAFDKIRNLCPPGWHWFIEPDGKVNLRGAEHARTHRLRLGIEITEFHNQQSIRNLKNYIIVKGRQDDNRTEPDQFGSIQFTAFDQASIDRYGKRVLFIRDANIKDPTTAELVGEGRLEENNQVEQAASASIPDEKSLVYTEGILAGYNIESFFPGDMVQIIDPLSGGQHTYWDQFAWDVGAWDSYTNRFLPRNVPIKTIRYHAEKAIIELSERQPSATGDFARMARALRIKEIDTND